MPTGEELCYAQRQESWMELASLNERKEDYRQHLS